MSPCQWDRSGGYSCTWICLNIYLSIIYFIWYTARYTMTRTCVPPDVTRSTKLRGAQRSPKLTFRSMDFRVPENLIFQALLISLLEDTPFSLRSLRLLRWLLGWFSLLLVAAILNFIIGLRLAHMYISHIPPVFQRLMYLTYSASILSE